jgi:hypothetical protein
VAALSSILRLNTMKFYLSLVILAPVLSISTGASDKPKQDGKSLIEEAEDKADIFALPTFQIKAKVRIENRGKMLEGSYQFLWNGPEQWREEITLPGYSEIQVGGKGVVFLKRTTDLLQIRIQQLHNALGYGTAVTSTSTFVHMGPLPNENIKKIHERRDGGVKLSCVELERDLSGARSNREVCVDPSSGTLVRRAPYHEGNWTPIGAKTFPHYLSYVEGGKPLVEIQITEFTISSALPPSTFGSPEGSTSRPGCMNPNPGYLLKAPPFSYTETFMLGHGIRGPEVAPVRSIDEVTIYALVGIDGVPQGLRVVSGENPELNRLYLENVQEKRFAPPTCNGHAVDFEQIFEVIIKVF